MSGETNMEAALVTLLKTLCPRVHPDAAPKLSVAWITYQHIGGNPLRYVDGAAASIRHSMVQIDAWATSKAVAVAMIRQIEDALCADLFINSTPITESQSQLSEDAKYFGMSQDFHIWFAR